jgi:hypothetical protein
LPKAQSSQGVWPLVLLGACCLLLSDVFVRRVQVSFAWAPALLRRWIGRKQSASPVETIQRLRSRKAEVSDRLEQLRAGMRFEPVKPAEPDVVLTEEAGPTAPPRPDAAPEQEQESYTERLLKAKRKAHKKTE